MTLRDKINNAFKSKELDLQAIVETFYNDHLLPFINNEMITKPSRQGYILYGDKPLSHFQTLCFVDHTDIIAQYQEKECFELEDFTYKLNLLLSKEGMTIVDKNQYWMIETIPEMNIR